MQQVAPDSYFSFVQQSILSLTAMALERPAIVQDGLPGPRIGSAAHNSALRDFTFDDVEVPAARERLSRLLAAGESSAAHHAVRRSGVR